LFLITTHARCKRLIDEGTVDSDKRHQSWVVHDYECRVLKRWISLARKSADLLWD
jgi:hypothetical protein